MPLRCTSFRAVASRWVWARGVPTRKPRRSGSGSRSARPQSGCRTWSRPSPPSAPAPPTCGSRWPPPGRRCWPSRAHGRRGRARRLTVRRRGGGRPDGPGRHRGCGEAGRQVVLNTNLSAVGDDIPAWLEERMGLTVDKLLATGAASYLRGTPRRDGQDPAATSRGHRGLLRLRRCRQRRPAGSRRRAAQGPLSHGAPLDPGQGYAACGPPHAAYLAAVGSW